MELLAWYNLVFVAPIGLAGIYLILSATGLGGDSDVDTGADMDHDVDLDMDHDVDIDMDHDVDLDLDHDVDLDMDHDVDIDMDHDVDLDMDHDVDLDMDHDVDLDMDHDVDMDADHDVDVSAEHDASVETHGVEHEVHDTHFSAHQDHSFLIRALSVLGVGKVPVSILVTTLMVIFGVTGLILNGLFENVLPWSWAPNLYFWPSFGVACVLSLTLTSRTARLLSRIMPTSETYAIGPQDLVGRVGVAIYPIAQGEHSTVNVRDDGGTWQRVPATAADGDVPKGAEVIVVRYHADTGRYDVSQSPLGEE